MTNKFQFACAAAALALLSACGSDADEPAEQAQPTDPGTPVVSVDDPQITNPDGYMSEDAGAGGADAGTIPVAMRGSWGMVAADCEPGRADAKGLLEIDATTLTFYESRGTLDDIEQRTGSSLRADFDFTGEGMEWERDMALEVQDGGQTLLRREFGEGAAAEPYRYDKCS